MQHARRVEHAEEEEHAADGLGRQRGHPDQRVDAEVEVQAVGAQVIPCRLSLVRPNRQPPVLQYLQGQGKADIATVEPARTQRLPMFVS